MIKKFNCKKSFRMQKAIEMNISVAQKVYLVNFIFATMYPSVQCEVYMEHCAVCTVQWSVSHLNPPIK